MNDEDHPWAAMFERWWATHPAAWNDAMNDFADAYPNACMMLLLLALLVAVFGCAGGLWLLILLTHPS